MSAHQVVVIGYGMAAARLVEDVRRADPDGRKVGLTIVGEEPVPAYNRILLSGVLTGRMAPETILLQDKAWVASHNVNLILGVAATAVDRTTRTVTLASGEQLRYDSLVFATGSSPWIPAIAGLCTDAGDLAPGVVAFRTLAECELLAEQVIPGTAVGVLGGGVLGLELARALLERTRHVTVVHPMAWIMERQLDQAAGRILAGVLAGLGIQFRIGRRAVRYVPGAGLRLDDASFVHANLVVVAAGARPETAVAEKAGLAVRKGILVNGGLHTSDPRIFAIGDCAQYGDMPTGVVEPAWDQARVLGELLTDERSGATYRGSKAVTSLKVPGVELVAFGDPHADLHAAGKEVLCLADPTGGRYAKLVLREDQVEGAIVLGLPDAAASIAHHYLNASLVPADRLSFLLGRGARTETGSMLCLCNGVTRASLADAWRHGARSIPQLVSATRATTGCGSCTTALKAMVDRLTTSEQP